MERMKAEAVISIFQFIKAMHLVSKKLHDNAKLQSCNGSYMSWSFHVMVMVVMVLNEDIYTYTVRVL